MKHPKKADLVSIDIAGLGIDLLLIMLASAGRQVHATPFWNSFRTHPPSRLVRLASLYRLVQDNRVYLEAGGQGRAGEQRAGGLRRCLTQLGVAAALPVDPGYNTLLPLPSDAALSDDDRVTVTAAPTERPARSDQITLTTRLPLYRLFQPDTEN